MRLATATGVSIAAFTLAGLGCGDESPARSGSNGGGGGGGGGGSVTSATGGGGGGGGMQCGEPNVVDAAPLATAPTCVDGFCWTYPTPHGLAPQRIWVSDSGTVHATSARLLRLQDGAWNTAPAPNPENKKNELSGFGDTAIAVIAGHGASRFENGSWVFEGSVGVPVDLWFGAGEGWMAGENGALCRRVTAWDCSYGEDDGVDFIALAGVAADDVWTVRRQGPSESLWHFDGAGWNQVVGEVGLSGETHIVARSSDDLWLFSQGDHFRYHAGMLEELQTPFSDVADAVLFDDEPTVLTSFGSVRRYDGGCWTELIDGDISAITASDGTLWAMDGAAGLVEVEGWQVIRHGVEDALTSLSSYEPRLVAHADDDVWMLDDKLRWDGSALQPLASALDVHMSDAWFDSASNGWLVSDVDARAYYWNGTMLTSYPLVGAQHVHSDGAGEVWACGAGGLVARFDGSGFIDVSTTLAVDLRDIYVAGPNDVWVVAHDDSKVLHYNGAWNDVTPESGDFYAVAGYGASVWVADNQQSRLHHYDGATWTVTTTTSYATLHPSSESELWMAGWATGRWLSGTWEMQTSSALEISLSPTGRVWAVGWQDLLSHDPGASIRTPTPCRSTASTCETQPPQAMPENAAPQVGR